LGPPKATLFRSVFILKFDFDFSSFYYSIQGRKHLKKTILKEGIMKCLSARGEQKALLKQLFLLGWMQFGSFRLKLHEGNPDTPVSPFKFNLRLIENGGPLMQDAVRAIALQMSKLIKEKELKFDVVAGVPQAGEPFAKEVSRLSKKPLVKLEKIVSANRREVVFRGGEGGGRSVLLIDDVITFADSKKEAIEALNKAGFIVPHLVVFVDRQQGGAELLKGKTNCKVYSVFLLDTILRTYRSIGKITQETYDELSLYVEKNKASAGS
jgi:orotate phosphoribosyltransferase